MKPQANKATHHYCQECDFSAVVEPRPMFRSYWIVDGDGTMQESNLSRAFDRVAQTHDMQYGCDAVLRCRNIPWEAPAVDSESQHGILGFCPWQSPISN